MKITRINYIKVLNRLQRQYGYSLGTKVMKQKIAKGLLPIEFLELHEQEKRLKFSVKQARRRFVNNYELRNAVYRKHGKKCRRCDSQVGLTIDHIKPLSLFPHLANELMNMQVLCRKCNSKKGVIY